MPLYDYRCHKCGEVFEVRQKFADAVLSTHEGCGGEVERLISAPALQFKGSGFYINDYAKGGSSPASSGSTSDSKPAAKSETASESKGDSKKTDSKPAPATSSKET